MTTPTEAPARSETNLDHLAHYGCACQVAQIQRGGSGVAWCGWECQHITQATPENTCTVCYNMLHEPLMCSRCGRRYYP